MKRCTKCKKSFSKNCDKLNYNLFNKFGFKNKKTFENHTSRHKNCPSNLHNEQIVNNVNWIPYKEPEINLEFEYLKDIALRRKEFHNLEGKKLWFNESKETAYYILHHIINNDVQFISLCAEPGSGKTAVIHNLIYSILTFTINLVPQTNISVTTGMSDTDWENQTIENFSLRDDNFLWDSLSKKDKNFCLVHRQNFNKRINYLLKNTEKLFNHIFIIDESHFADDKDMTIDNEFKKLGLNQKRMKEYKIKIILVSATPDVNLSIFSREENHKLVILKNGPEYKGFEFYYNNEMIIDYNPDLNIEYLIKNKYKSSRFHFIRARTSQEKGEYIEDDSNNNFYISHQDDVVEKSFVEENKNIIRTYLEPKSHTLILIKNKYQASKRLKLTKYVGIISEKPAKKMNSSVTCNGLIPRFFGYEPLPEFINNEPALFYCNIECIQQYIKFCKDFIYEGKDYTSQRLISNENKLTEKKGTVYSELVKLKPLQINYNIRIKTCKSKEEDSKFFKDNLKKNIPDSFIKDKGYIISTRLTSYYTKYKAFLNSEDRLTYDKYLTISDTLNISGTGKGQNYMVYYVYDNETSLNDTLTYYIHYLD